MDFFAVDDITAALVVVIFLTTLALRFLDSEVHITHTFDAAAEREWCAS